MKPVGLVDWSGPGPRPLAGVLGRLPHQEHDVDQRHRHDSGPVWTPAITSDGEIGEGAEVAGLLDLRRWPAGMRVIVRRERPHPGAQLSLLEEADGWRYQAFATNTRAGQLAFLEARHRAHARVEDRIKAAKDTGLDA